ncbi:hypothetical protein IBE48_09750 [Francisella philomiragia]|uniref:hypothetical protein n=1 Tax=Francisella philomiragia TaxID=28110 RepID=UPI001902EB53|nr:hypothetical protein [Francisella philomiragia]MBK2255728.1 hypothetical protein [Francisella philomiragia]MBK2274042.1 hypothetical protein [Francisella philomiragia]MBK2277887.1 hypothetical protein [Francisella philomiragia]MBK2281831.1 hypothetical protein [Francisella philomiragia]MBK2283783.1 hypothetical protein [Francisella philomiragia]
MDDYKLEPWGKIFKDLFSKILKKINYLLMTVFAFILLFIVVGGSIYLSKFLGISQTLQPWILIFSFVFYFALLFFINILIRKAKKMYRCKK